MNEQNQIDSVATTSRVTIKEIGEWMFIFGFAFFTLGRVVIRIFFPELRDHSLRPGVLILIWAFILSGALLWLIGYLRGKRE